jgi:hypothetical protein
VKTLCADASVDFVDVKVGHCQALNLMKTKPSLTKVGEGFFYRQKMGRRTYPLYLIFSGNNPAMRAINDALTSQYVML